MGTTSIRSWEGKRDVSSKPESEGKPEKTGRIVIRFRDQVPSFVFQTEFPRGFHATQQGQLCFPIQTVGDAPEEGQGTVIPDPFGRNTVIVESKPQSLITPPERQGPFRVGLPIQHQPGPQAGPQAAAC